jgi:hypothetical protein
VADKLTQQLVDGLSRAAAEPAGLPLFAYKSDPGLFPTTAKAAAQKCVADRLLRVVRIDERGKQPRELYGLTEAGWDYLLAAVNPRQVLEDFVRVLEQRQGEVGELLGTARVMAESLQGLKDAVARVLPQVVVNRIATSKPPDLCERILDELTGWSASANAGEDCPLPQLYRGLCASGPQPSLGEFHDALRKIHAAGAIYLHPWTGPLYELPDPACALLVGHGVAYYASARSPVGARYSREAASGVALEVHG